MSEKVYFTIRNEKGKYLKVRSIRYNWVTGIKGATTGTYAQMQTTRENIKNSPYYENSSIVEVGKGLFAWEAKKNMAKNPEDKV